MAAPPGNAAGRSNSSGAFMGPPRPEAWINPETGTLLTTAYAFIYGLWLRTGGTETISNTGGVGQKALQYEIDQLIATNNEALILGLFAGDDVVLPVDNSDTSLGLAAGAMIFGDGEMQQVFGQAQTQTLLAFGGRL